MTLTTSSMMLSKEHRTLPADHCDKADGCDWTSPRGATAAAAAVDRSRFEVHLLRAFTSQPPMPPSRHPDQAVVIYGCRGMATPPTCCWLHRAMRASPLNMSQFARSRTSHSCHQQVVLTPSQTPLDLTSAHVLLNAVLADTAISRMIKSGHLGRPSQAPAR